MFCSINWYVFACKDFYTNTNTHICICMYIHICTSKLSCMIFFLARDEPCFIQPIGTFVYEDISLCIHVSIYTHTYICECVRIYTQTPLKMCNRLREMHRVLFNEWVRLCMHTFLYTYTYHVYMYIHMHSI